MKEDAAFELAAVLDQIIKLEATGSFLFINGIAKRWKRFVKFQCFFCILLKIENIHKKGLT